jgi:hypothetical protein
MTQERYLLMCEQLGKEPNLEEMPRIGMTSHL